MFCVKGTLVVFLASICLVYCAVSFEQRNPNAAPDTCISTVNRLNMRANEVQQLPDKCIEASCQANGDIIYHGCGKVGIPPNCRFVEPDLSLPYPDCCEEDFICDE